MLPGLRCAGGGLGGGGSSSGSGGRLVLGCLAGADPGCEWPHAAGTGEELGAALGLGVVLLQPGLVCVWGQL